MTGFAEEPHETELRTEHPIRAVTAVTPTAGLLLAALIVGLMAAILLIMLLRRRDEHETTNRRWVLALFSAALVLAGAALGTVYL